MKRYVFSICKKGGWRSRTAIAGRSRQASKTEVDVRPVAITVPLDRVGIFGSGDTDQWRCDADFTDAGI